MRKKSVWALLSLAALAAVLGAACGGDDSGSGGGGSGVCSVSCDGVPKFADLNWSLCTSCHSSDASVRSQQGVPADSDYTTYEGASKRAEDVAARVNDTSLPMPPNGSAAPSAAEKEAFTKWGCCDAPQ